MVITADEGRNKRFLTHGLLIFDNKRSNSESDKEGEESRLKNFERDMAAQTATDTVLSEEHEVNSKMKRTRGPRTIFTHAD